MARTVVGWSLAAQGRHRLAVAVLGFLPAAFTQPRTATAAA
ncbi:hypothetical protein [Streptomyces sp. NK08204]|nr:hypothetical protein [Streptomyces sp. NK08204]